MLSYTIYDRQGNAMWTTYSEDEAWAKVVLTLGQYVEAHTSDNEKE